MYPSSDFTPGRLGAVELHIREWQMLESCRIVRHFSEQPGHAIPNDVEIDGSVNDRCSVSTKQSPADPVNQYE